MVKYYCLLQAYTQKCVDIYIIPCKVDQGAFHHDLLDCSLWFCSTYQLLLLNLKELLYTIVFVVEVALKSTDISLKLMESCLVVVNYVKNNVYYKIFWKFFFFWFIYFYCGNFSIKDHSTYEKSTICQITARFRLPQAKTANILPTVYT